MSNDLVKPIIETKTMVIDEILKPEYDMKYREINDKLIKYVEQKIRSSFEYRNYIDFLKHSLGVDQCAYYAGFSIANGLSVQIHHHPFTLSDITQVVMLKQMKENGGWYDENEVAEYVMYLHFRFLIGLTPLSPSLHKMIHEQNKTGNNWINISPEIVIGDWKTFGREFDEFLTDSMRDKLIDFEKEEMNPDRNKYPEILTKEKTIIEVPKFAPLNLKEMLDCVVQQKILEFDKELEQK